MISSKNAIALLLLFLVVFIGCQNSIQKNKMNVDTDEQVKKDQEMMDYFKLEQLKNERKWDSLQLKEDSFRNKSTLSGFIDDVPIFNETTEIKQK